MQFNTLALLALAYFSFEAAGESDYAASCSSIVYSEETDVLGTEPGISADCGSGTSWINLNDCFACSDADGSIIGEENGWIIGGCEDLSLDGTVLSASCWSNDIAGPVDASIDTNDYIGNVNGQLTCFGETGDAAA